MDLLLKILWRLFTLPLLFYFTPLILLTFSLLKMDKSWWDTKKSFLYLLSVGLYGYQIFKSEP